MKIFFIAPLFAFISTLTQAFPIINSQEANFHNYEASTALADNIEFHSEFNWSGIVALSNCSGSLVRLIPDMNAPVYILTNGHCAGFPKPGVTILNKPQIFRTKVYDNSKSWVKIQSSHIVYSTMTGTDFALLNVNLTQYELAALNVKVYDFNSYGGSVNEPIFIPSGYWNKLYSCEIQAIAYKSMEAGWSFYGSYRHTCSVIGGTSGSPMVSQRTGDVVGVNNSINVDGEQCTMNNPCEVDANGTISVHQGMGYGQRTVDVLNCTDNRGNFDVNQPNCQLNRFQSIELSFLQ